MTRIVIIGAGHSGICLGASLAQRGIRSFTILEKADRLGGTWRDNVYPGAACDSPAFAYCYSFEQKTDWSRKWAPQPEILAYQEHCAAKYSLLPHIQFGTELASARWSADDACWRLRTTGGRDIECEILVSATGQLSRPRTPDIPGLADFRGDSFHSAAWDRSCTVRGKNVAIVGNAASAVQLVPEVAKVAKQLYVFQRSANWVLPKNDRVYGRFEQALYGRIRPLAKLYRWWLWASYEARYPLIRNNQFLAQRASQVAKEHIEQQIGDPALRAALWPNYPIGSKRVLISDDYYPALTRANVELVTDAIEGIENAGIVTRGGKHYSADTIIFATGFDTTSFLSPIEITGTGCVTLDEAWADGAEAFLGISVAGFPNLFLMYGPNTNLGHNSIIFMIECQTRYILDCLAHMTANGVRAMTVRSDVQERYNAEIRADLDNTVWARVAKSWYHHANGRITNNWPRSTPAYWWSTRRANPSDYVASIATR